MPSSYFVIATTVMIALISRNMDIFAGLEKCLDATPRSDKLGKFCPSLYFVGEKIANLQL